MQTIWTKLLHQFRCLKAWWTPYENHIDWCRICFCCDAIFEHFGCNTYQQLTRCTDRGQNPLKAPPGLCRLELCSRFMQQAFFVASSNVGQEMQIFFKVPRWPPKIWFKKLWDFSYVGPWCNVFPIGRVWLIQHGGAMREIELIGAECSVAKQTQPNKDMWWKKWKKWEPLIHRKWEVVHKCKCFQVMLLTFVPNQSESFHLVELSSVVTWGLDHPMILFLAIPLVGICYRWCLELQLSRPRSCSLAFGRHPPGLVHPGGPTRRGNRDKGGPFRVGDSSTFETLLWEVANGHWAVQKIWWRFPASRKDLGAFFLVRKIANETFWSSCLLKTECVFVCSYISLFRCLRRIVSSGTEVL